MEVDRSSPVAPYVQVAGQLRDEIISGRRAPGSRLPSADSIAQDVGIARLTARKALKVLRDEGYAFAAVGMGTYVAERERWPPG